MGREASIGENQGEDCGQQVADIGVNDTTDKLCPLLSLLTHSVGSAHPCTKSYVFIYGLNIRGDTFTIVNTKEYS